MRNEQQLQTALKELIPDVDETRGWFGIQHHLTQIRRRRRLGTIAASLGSIAIVGVVIVLSRPPAARAILQVYGPLPQQTSTLPSYGGSDYQQAILNDGHVTLTEIQSALSNTTSCLRDAGFDVQAELEPSGTYGLTFQLANPDIDPTSDPAYTSCMNQYLSNVGKVWANQHWTQANDQAFYETVAACLRDHGLAASDAKPTTLDHWIKQEPDIYDQCFNETLHAFGSEWPSSTGETDE
jgi:hypothetical protein